MFAEALTGILEKKNAGDPKDRFKVDDACNLKKKKSKHCFVSSKDMKTCPFDATDPSVVRQARINAIVMLRCLCTRSLERTLGS